MDAKVNPLVAALVIGLTIVAAGIWSWANGSARELGGPSGLSVDHDGHLYVQIQNQLLEHDTAGQFVRRHDLSNLGIDILFGSIAFFSNGDVLLRRGPDTRTFADNFRAFQRATNRNSIKPDAPLTGMYRCNLETLDCSVFGDSLIDFKAAFSVYIDRQTDEVYISDSTRHVLRKYSGHGDAIAEPAGGFRFPNHLALHDQQLFVADTNHHRIRVLKPDSAGFGSEYYDIDVVPDRARKNGQTWPNHFAFVGGRLWVNNMRTGMNYGGIYIFDNRWQFQHQVDLPDDADPIALLPFNGEVLVSDWYGDRVHRVAASGTLIGDFRSPGLQQVLTESATERRKFQIYGWAAAGNCAILIVILLVRGVSRNPHVAEPDVSADIDDIPADDIVWLEPSPANVRKLVKSLSLSKWLVGPLIVVLAFLTWATSDLKAAYDLSIAIAGFISIYLLARWMVQVNTATAIGLQRDRVTLRDHTGREAKYRLSEIFFNDQFVASDDIAVFMGQPQMPIYERVTTIRQMASHLPAAQRISSWQMQKKLVAMRHPNGIVLVIAVLLLAITALLLLFRQSI